MEPNIRISNGVQAAGELISKNDSSSSLVRVPIVVSMEDVVYRCGDCGKNQTNKDEEGENSKNDESSAKDLLLVPNRTSFMELESAREKRRLALLKQCAAILKQTEENYTKETLRKTFQNEDLIELIFRLFDFEEKDYLVRKEWLHFLKERLVGSKQIDLLEHIKGVVYELVGDGNIRLNSFIRIWKNKVVIKKLLRALDTDCDGCVSVDTIMEFLFTITSSRPRANFDQDLVKQTEQLFKQTVGNQNGITKEQLKSIVGSNNEFFTDRVFQLLDVDDSGAISLQEFISAVHQFQTPDDKLRFLFQVYDVDGDGLIQHHELEEVMEACVKENCFEFDKAKVHDLTTAMLEDADTENRGAITFEALRTLLGKHEGLLESLSITIDRWLLPSATRPDRQSKSLLQRLADLKPYQLSLPYLKNNYAFLSYLAVFFLVNIGLFVSRAIEYRNNNGFVILARACGQCLNFTCAWILVLMLRQSITQLRARGWSAVLPLDHHIYLHKLTGVLIAGYSLLHTIMHLCNFSIIVVNDPKLNANNYTLSEWLLTSRPGLFGLVGGCANPTGVALCALLCVVCACSVPAVRRGGRFEIFYWTHLLYIPFWILLIFHGPNFWKWFLLPGAIYVTERILRLAWMKSERGKTHISSGIMLKPDVIHLVVKRPPHFEFRAGDYVFINVPAIATYEWHPFTISSAPEQTEYIWLHIRAVGQWTNRLYAYFEKEHEKLLAASAQAANEKVARSISSKGDQGIDKSPAEDKKKALDKKPSMKDSVTKLTHALRLKNKSSSMPDVMMSQKKRQKLFELQDVSRSESENSFDKLSMNRALASVYKDPQNRALERNYRYMRNKPAIVVMNTPTDDDDRSVRRRSNDSIITQVRRRLSHSLSPDKDVETPSINVSPSSASMASVTSTQYQYPVGKPLEIYLDGPYGAASSNIAGVEHAVLVAAGIGVTPFASILQSLMCRHWAARAVCPRCQCVFRAAPPTHTRLRKVDFFWINRFQQSFEWFVSLLSQLEMEQAEMGGERFLEMHMYITGVLRENDMKALLLFMALDLMHKKEKRDLITGLKTRTHRGHPQWEEVFKQLQEQNKGKVTMFYCGPPQLGRILRKMCNDFKFNFRKEVF